MGRLCERPGCSEPASVAYGMRAEDLVFWLDTLRPHTYQSSGVLCLRHAESMVVPRHWTLDDLRDPVPRLFRPPNPATAPPPPRRRRKTGTETSSDQLLLTTGEEYFDAEDAPAPHAATNPIAAHPPPATTTPSAGVDSGADRPETTPTETTSAESTPWTPTFDESDDLGGLLSARSPLLARAFRGDGRPKPA